MAFIKFDKIDGQATQKPFEKWIPLMNYQWGENRLVTMSTQASSNRGEGSTQFQEFSFSTEMDVATTKLALACATGQVFTEVLFQLAKSGGDNAKGREPYSLWVMENVIVTSYSIGGTPNDVPVESFSLSMTKMTHEYKKVDQKTGALSTGGTFSYDIATDEM